MSRGTGGRRTGDRLRGVRRRSCGQTLAARTHASPRALGTSSRLCCAQRPSSPAAREHSAPERVRPAHRPGAPFAVAWVERSMARTSPPRYDSTTSGLRRTSSGVPSAITRPDSMAMTRSDSRITNGMSCSMTSMRDAEPIAEPSEQVAERLGLALRDARRRLVEQQHARLERDQACELGDAARAGRELADLLVRYACSPSRRPARAPAPPCAARPRRARRSRRRTRVGSPRSSASCTVSITVSVGNSAASWNERIRPSSARASGPRRLMSRPANTTAPVSDRTNPPISSNSVVLPAPFGPMSPSVSPDRTCDIDVVDGGDPAVVLGQLRATSSSDLVAPRRCGAARPTQLRVQTASMASLGLDRDSSSAIDARPAREPADEPVADRPHELGEAAGEVEDQDEPARAWWRRGPRCRGAGTGARR